MVPGGFEKKRNSRGGAASKIQEAASKSSFIDMYLNIYLIWGHQSNDLFKCQINSRSTNKAVIPSNGVLFYL